MKPRESKFWRVEGLQQSVIPWNPPSKSATVFRGADPSSLEIRCTPWRSLGPARKLETVLELLNFFGNQVAVVYWPSKCAMME